MSPTVTCRGFGRLVEPLTAYTVLVRPPVPMVTEADVGFDVALPVSAPPAVRTSAVAVVSFETTSPWLTSRSVEKDGCEQA